MASVIPMTCREPSDLVYNNDILETHETFNMLQSYSTQEQAIPNDILNFMNISLTSLPGEHRSCRVDSSSGRDLRKTSTCPWHYVMNYDPNRRPETLVEAKCNCRPHRSCLNGIRNSHCSPIIYNVWVLRKYACDVTTGVYLYRRSLEPIVIGCTCIVRN